MSILHVLIIHVQDGRTALYIASWKGHVKVVQFLLQKDVDVSNYEMVQYSNFTTTYYYYYYFMSHTIPIYVPVTT